jgi:hypothetical protein
LLNIQKLFPGSAGVPPAKLLESIPRPFFIHAGETLNAAYFLRPQGAFGVRQQAAAFQKRSKPMFFTSLLKAAASCRTPKASPCKKYAALGETAVLPGG